MTPPTVKVIFVFVVDSSCALFLLFGEQRKHFVRDGATRERVDVGPSLRRVEKRTDCVVARDTSRSNNDSFQSLNRGIKGWQVAIDARGAERKVCRTHGECVERSDDVRGDRR